MSEPSKPCDVDDIICQVQALTHLKGLQSSLGGERYAAEFPELQGLEEKINLRTRSLTNALGNCGIDLSTLPSEISSGEESDVQ